MCAVFAPSQSNVAARGMPTLLYIHISMAASLWDVLAKDQDLSRYIL
jgi:hypothetical protein